MTSTGIYKGLADGRNSSKVLKPPGGGSSDIFGAGHPGHNEHSGRKQVLAKNANQSQLSHGFFSESETDLAPAPQAQQAPATPVSQNGSTSSIGSGSAPDTPRSSKPGNDSYNRLFGPPDAPPPSTPNSNTYRSTISLNNVVATPPNDDNSSQVSLTGQQQLMQPPAGITSNTSTILVNPTGGVTATGSEYGSSTALNDHPATNWSAANNVVAAAHHNGNSINGTNGYHHNDVIGGLSGMPRNPVTGDGVDMKPPATRRYFRRSKDGNPVTGAGYDMQHNGGGSTGSSIAGSDKSSTDSSPSVAPVQRMKNRVPPGGFSSGLW